MSTKTNTQDTQGQALGLPYDFRKPSWEKAKARLWNPGGPMMPPKVWGWGWTLNLAHRGSWIILAATAATVTIALLSTLS